MGLNHNADKIRQAEKLILEKSPGLYAEEYSNVVIERVEIEFEETDSSRRRACSSSIDDNGFLKIRLRDTDLLSGVKLYFAKTASDIESEKQLESFREILILDFFIPFLYPLIILVADLYFVFLLSRFGILYTITLSTFFFSVMVLPVSVWRRRHRFERERNRINAVSYQLELISLFSNKEETQDYAKLVCKEPAFETLFDFVMYLVNLPFLIMIAGGMFIQ